MLVLVSRIGDNSRTVTVAMAAIRVVVTEHGQETDKQDHWLQQILIMTPIINSVN